MKQILILVFGIIFSSNIIAQQNNIEKENFMIVYNTCMDLNTEISLINTSSTFLSDQILLSKDIISMTTTYYSYNFKFGKPIKDESSEKIKEYKYNLGVMKTDNKLGKNGEFTDVEIIATKKKNDKVIEIIKYKYNGEDVDVRYLFTYNNNGQIIEKKELKYEHFSMNPVIHSEISRYTYTSDNKLESCSISKIKKEIEEKPYSIYKWQYDNNGILIKETLSIDFFGLNHYLDEYTNNSKYGWVEKKSFKGNPKTKEWELTSITNREYVDEQEFQKKQIELQKEQKIKLLFSYWSENTIKIFNANKRLTNTQFESLLNSNRPYFCLKINIVDKYKKETKKIADDYQYSDGEPIEYQYFQLEELNETINSVKKDVLKLIENIVADLNKLSEYENQLKSDISINDNTLNKLFLTNDKVVKNKFYIHKTYTEYKGFYGEMKIELLEAKKKFQEKIIALSEDDSKDLNKALNKVEKLDERVKMILTYTE